MGQLTRVQRYSKSHRKR